MKRQSRAFSFLRRCWVGSTLLLCLFVLAGRAQAFDRVENDTLRVVVQDTAAVDSSLLGKLDRWTLKIPTTLYRGLFGIYSISAHTITGDTTTLDSTVYQDVQEVFLVVPKTLYEGILKTYELGVRAADPDRVMRIADMYTGRGRTWGWYPYVLATSYIRPKVGGRIFYRKPYLGASFDGSYAGPDKWRQRYRVTLRDTTRYNVRQANFSVYWMHEDDMIYKGIGNSPQNDPRSHLCEDFSHDYGRFREDLILSQIVLGVRTNPRTDYRYTAMATGRRIGGGWEYEDGFAYFADPAFVLASAERDWRIYQELALHYDTTFDDGRGFDGEAYVGLSVGFKDEGAHFARYGFDVTSSSQVIDKNHFLKLRIVGNMMEEMQSKEEIKFYDYPRHQTFRGLSPRFLYRIDEVVFVPSVEFERPILGNISASVFADYLTVAPSIKELQLGKGVWSAGVAMAYKDAYSDLAGVMLAYGPEGVRATAFIGAQPNRNERTRWR